MFYFYDPIIKVYLNQYSKVYLYYVTMNSE